MLWPPMPEIELTPMPFPIIELHGLLTLPPLPDPIRGTLRWLMEKCLCKCVTGPCIGGFSRAAAPGHVVPDRMLEIHDECAGLHRIAQSKLDSAERADLLHSVAKRRETGTLADGDAPRTRTASQQAYRKARLREFRAELQAIADYEGMPLCVATTAAILCCSTNYFAPTT